MANVIFRKEFVHDISFSRIFSIFNKLQHYVNSSFIPNIGGRWIDIYNKHVHVIHYLATGRKRKQPKDFLRIFTVFNAMYIQGLFKILKMDKYIQYTDPTSTCDMTHYLITRRKGSNPTKLRVATFRTFRLFRRDTLY